MNYFVFALAADDIGDVAQIDDHPEDLPFKSYHFHKGKPLLEKIELPLKYQFSDDKPEGRKLVDLQYNTLGLFIVSEKLAAILEGEADIEFIPVEIYDHRGKLASKNYFIANFLNVCDVVDEDKSKYVVDPFDEEEYDWIKKLVFDQSKLDESINVFRLKQSLRTVILTEPLVNKMKQENIQGPLFVPIEKFDSAYYMGV